MTASKNWPHLLQLFGKSNEQKRTSLHSTITIFSKGWWLLRRWWQYLQVNFLPAREFTCRYDDDDDNHNDKNDNDNTCKWSPSWQDRVACRRPRPQHPPGLLCGPPTKRREPSNLGTFGQIQLSIWTNSVINLDKFSYQFGQIQFLIWTNSVINLDKFSYQFGQIQF